MMGTGDNNLLPCYELKFHMSQPTNNKILHGGHLTLCGFFCLAGNTLNMIFLQGNVACCPVKDDLSSYIELIFNRKYLEVYFSSIKSGRNLKCYHIYV